MVSEALAVAAPDRCGRDDVHADSAEGYFSIFKRGMKGVYQHCSEKHLHRYLAEFDFCYNVLIVCSGLLATAAATSSSR